MNLQLIQESTTSFSLTEIWHLDYIMRDFWEFLHVFYDKCQSPWEKTCEDRSDDLRLEIFLQDVTGG